MYMRSFSTAQTLGILLIVCLVIMAIIVFRKYVTPRMSASSARTFQISTVCVAMIAFLFAVCTLFLG